MGGKIRQICQHSRVEHSHYRSTVGPYFLLGVGTNESGSNQPKRIKLLQYSSEKKEELRSANDQLILIA
jgi:hypothetical protein